MTIDQLKNLRESENKVEFKEAKGGNFSFNGGSRTSPNERRRCILGYVTAFANEGGGFVVLGISDKHPHVVVGTNQSFDAIGKLEQEIYRDSKIRVKVYELYDPYNKRVVVLEIPSRPIGKIFKFEDVPLMRVGEELLPMNDAQYLKIIQEQEPDFSAKICDGLDFHDLDPTAIEIMKNAYAYKQGNSIFLTLPNEQALQDLSLMYGSKVTYAALILLGKVEAIRRHLPQSAISLEFRNSTSQITFDSRQFFHESYYVSIEKLWEAINQRNGAVPVQRGAYIFDIPYFNKEVIREAINNAIAHRDYQKNSETLIKQSLHTLQIINAGGFPLGVNIENLLTINSTPRNRLLCDVMAKTGVVERSGQGIDKIYYQSLSEAKLEPDYTNSDDFQVDLRLSGIVEDKAFALFIKEIQADRRDGEKLSVQEIICLNRVRKGEVKSKLDLEILRKLEKEDLVERIGKTNSQRYILSKAYYIFTDRKGEYSMETNLDQSHIVLLILKHLQEFRTAKMGDFELLLNKFLTRDQVKYLVGQLVVSGILDKDGKNKGTRYTAGKQLESGARLTSRALELGLEEMKKRGEY